MDPLVVGLLGSLGVVVALGALFLVIYRRHLRALRRAGRGLDPLSPLTSARRRAVPFLMPPRWIAIRSTNTPLVRDALGLLDVPAVAWSEALSRSRERALFVSPPVDGWTLVIGAALPDPATDVDVTYRMLHKLSRSVGEVQFFNADRVLNFHAWARLEDGQVPRGYAWAGGTLWNEGRMTLEERLLGMKCRAYAEDPEPVRYGEIPPEQQNTERVILLARRWSIDPVAASEILLHQEAVESDDDWREES
jgi:hypothetical protein